MKESFKTLRGGYQTPECEVVNLAVESAVLTDSTGISTISDWSDDEDSLEAN